MCTGAIRKLHHLAIEIESPDLGVYADGGDVGLGVRIVRCRPSICGKAGASVQYVLDGEVQ